VTSSTSLSLGTLARQWVALLRETFAALTCRCGALSLVQRRCFSPIQWLKWVQAQSAMASPGSKVNTLPLSTESFCAEVISLEKGESRGLDAAAVGEVLGRRYDVISRVGRGGSGEVWLVWDTEDRCFLAAKLFYLSRHLAERVGVGIVLSLDHPGIIEILGYQKSRNHHFKDAIIYYFMPPADRLTTLHRFEPMDWPSGYVPFTLENCMYGAHPLQGTLVPSDCAKIVLELSDALGYLHQRGLVYRDFKPSNVVRVNGKWVIADIGLLAPVGSDNAVGTRGYIPPEGHGMPSGDVYSLGVVLTKMLERTYKQRWSPLECKILRLLEKVARKATEQNAADRYTSAVEMREDLAKIERLLK
jgi:serine/threonine protein kinase